MLSLLLCFKFFWFCSPEHPSFRGRSKLGGDRTAFRDFADNQATSRFMLLWLLIICSYPVIDCWLYFSLTLFFTGFCYSLSEIQLLLNSLISFFLSEFGLLHHVFHLFIVYMKQFIGACI